MSMNTRKLKAIKRNTMKLNLMQSGTRDHVPILSYVAIVYLITMGISALLR